MKKIFQIFSSLVLAALSLTACSDNWSPGEETAATGQVRLHSMGVEVSDAENVVSRTASRASQIDLSNFIVTITNAQGMPVAEYLYKDMPGVIVLPVGAYTVNVRSHNVKKAAFDEPYYTGSGSFTIRQDEIVDIGVVTCKFSSIRVSIIFDEALKEKLGDDAKVTVIANDEGSLVFTPAETRSGYFEAVAASTTIIAQFEATLKGESEKVTKTVTFTDGVPGNHYKISFKLKSGDPTIPDEMGGVTTEGSEIIDASVTDVNHNANINIDDDIINGNRPTEGDDPTPPEPGPDEPVTETISITAVEPLSFDKPNPVTLTSGVANIHADDKVAHLIVKIETTSAAFAASVSDLMPMEFDLAYPGSYLEAFKGLGFPVSDDPENPVLGQTDLKFDITQFIPLLGAFDGTHKFSLTVTDEKGKQLSKTLTFVK